MPALTPQFMFDFEKRMRVISENEYARMVLAENLWWDKVARVMPSGGKAERIAWLLSTAQIKPAGLGGNINFDSLVSATTEYTNEIANAGLKLRRDQVEDNDGDGFELAGQWSGDISAYMAYWPQRKTAETILNGEVGKTYDGLPYFSKAHPVNPYALGAGSYANLFTGAPSGNYPGALPIDTSVTVDVALQNMGKAVAAIASVKMPNGEDPRFLRARGILCAPAMVPRVQQLTNAKFIAQAAAGGAGAADVEQMVRNWGFAPPIEVQEFAASTTYTLADGTQVTGSDTDWYIYCESVRSSQLGGLVYVDREPFKITYYTGTGGGTGVDAILDRARELEWHCQGRNVSGYGHPYALFKFKST